MFSQKKFFLIISNQIEDVQLQMGEMGIEEGKKPEQPTEETSSSSSKSSTPLRQLPKSLVVVAMVTLKGIAGDAESEVVVNGQLRKDGAVVIGVSEKKSNVTETLVIEAEVS